MIVCDKQNFVDGCSQHAWSLLRRHWGCFPGNAWQTNAVNNSVTFQETRNSTITLFSAPNVPIIIEGQIGVTFLFIPNTPIKRW